MRALVESARTEALESSDNSTVQADEDGDDGAAGTMSQLPNGTNADGGSSHDRDGRRLR
jgi:hypothetical protein